MSEEDNEASEDKSAEDAMADEWAAAMEEQDEAEASSDDTETVGLEEFDNNPNASGVDNPELEIILDIPVTISMEVGSTAITIRNLLQLNQGSVIELDRLAGEPLNVLVNGTLIAHGEVVVVNEKFGIRMTDVISPSERIKKLG
ncbi:MAG: flagellar motor switch protein FliN [Cellvibrionaceae bacterium]|nr:flagellar motor switch protein FliN [Cellvibrionaceae bacterium]